jgi:hypothetical protein
MWRGAHRFGMGSFSLNIQMADIRFSTQRAGIHEQANCVLGPMRSSSRWRFARVCCFYDGVETVLIL